MYDAVVLPLAKQDIKEAAIWYNAKQKGLGKRFTQQVRSKVQLLRQNPKLFSIRYDAVRTAVLDVFPFMIHYSISENEKQIVIIALFHTSLNPKRWERR